MGRSPSFLIFASMLAISAIQAMLVWHHTDIATSARKVAAMERQLAAEVRNLNKHILLFQERAESLDESKAGSQEIHGSVEPESDVIRAALRRLGAEPIDSGSAKVSAGQ